MTTGADPPPTPACAGTLSRRRFVGASTATAFGLGVAGQAANSTAQERRDSDSSLTLFLCGDVMLGRGIDQILPHSVDPVLQESYVTSARDYVTLAERAHGPIPRDVPPAYVWGDALAMLREAAPEVRIINLETSVTDGGEFWPKAVNYRMAPEHVSVLRAAGIDCCSLANNHVLDFGRDGLRETLESLRAAGLSLTGAGLDSGAAAEPAILEGERSGRVLVFGYGATSSGIPAAWGATPESPGVSLLPDLSDATLARVVAHAAARRRPDDLLVASIHWGGNWGYAVPAAQIRFAHGLVEGGFDVVHGHSSHHPKAVEIHRGKPILYGCGDFITDYEGIRGHERFRGEISVAYLATFTRPGNNLASLRLVPFRIRRFRLEVLPGDHRAWLAEVLKREAGRFGADVRLGDDGAFEVGIG